MGSSMRWDHVHEDHLHMFSGASCVFRRAVNDVYVRRIDPLTLCTSFNSRVIDDARARCTFERACSIHAMPACRLHLSATHSISHQVRMYPIRWYSLVGMHGSECALSDDI